MPVLVRLVCPQCGRPTKEFGYDSDGVRPTASHSQARHPTVFTPPADATQPGANENRWRVWCSQPRCTTARVVKATTIAARAQAALNTGRYSERALTGMRRTDARRSIEAGTLRSWEQARQTFSGAPLVVLVLGEDL